MDVYLELLRRRDIRRIICSAIPARLAYSMVGLSFFFYAKDLHHSLALAGLVIGANTLTSAGSAGIRGAAVDRYGQTKPLALLAPFYCATLILAACVSLDSALTVGLAALNGLCSPPINLSTRPLYKMALPADKVRAAWALDTTMGSTMLVLGPAVATLLALQVSPRVALLTTGVLMLGGSYGLLTSAVSRRWRSEPTIAGAAGIFQTPAMWVLAIDGLAFGLGLGALDVAIPSAASLHHDQALAAPLLAAFALGGVIGGVWAGAMAKRARPLRGLRICSVITVALLLLLPVTNPGWLMGVVLVGAGVATGPAQIFLLEVLDLVRPRGAAVRSQGWLWSIEGGAAAIGSSAAGALAASHGSAAALSLVGGCAFISPIALWVGRRHFVGPEGQSLETYRPAVATA